MALFKKKPKKAARVPSYKGPANGSLKRNVMDIENDIRDLINWVKIMNEEELKIGEGKKIEDDTANELVIKLKKLAMKVGAAL